MDTENSIMATKQEFEDSFSSGDFYNKQTQDEHHLKNILNFLPLKADMKILDLGTGSGYLSFCTFVNDVRQKPIEDRTQKE